MEKNKTGKYFKYAIGEIILVMIGILLALQVNEWNLEKQNRSYEITMLKEVYEVLVVDLKNINRNISYLKQVKYSIHEITRMKNDLSIPRDSLYEHLDFIDGYGTAFLVNRSPFEAIESGGLDKISNTEIRNVLSTLYGFTLESTEGWINQVLRNELFKRNELKEEIFGYNIVAGKEFGIRNKLIIENFETVLKHPKIDTYLYTSGWPLTNTIRLMETSEGQMNELKGLIEKEIKK